MTRMTRWQVQNPKIYESEKCCEIIKVVKADLGALYLESPKEAHRGEPPEEEDTPGMFESDIKLTPEQNEVLSSLIEEENPIDDGDGVIEKRKAIGNLLNRWPQATVPYEIDSSVTDSYGIFKAIRHWEYHTCIRFMPRSPQLETQLGHSDYVLFVKGNSFYSYIGRVNLGAQTLSIGDELRTGSIGHELGHAIGFWHEQSRPDRDEYITVLYENIQPEAFNAFQKYDWGKVLTHDIPYDIGSLMHYGSHYFSKNNLTTIYAKNPNDQSKLGNRITLTKSDVELANLMYSCPDTTGCIDKFSNCGLWASKGHCERKYAGFMKRQCPKSCNVCHVCVDKHINCAFWEAVGYCKGEYEGYVSARCRLSCGLCSVLDTPEFQES